MSDTDSFISEVTEEVQRDKLYGYVRKYGWMVALAILLIVGGAAWNEYRKASETASARATGDALFAALSENDADARATALANVEVEGPAIAVTALTTAAAQQEAGDDAGAVATLEKLINDQEVPAIYRDLAAFKIAILPGADLVQRRSLLESLANPGAPLNLLAQEQLAYLELESGNAEAAIAGMLAIVEDAGVTRGLRDRAIGLIVALGAEDQLAAEQ